MNSIYNETHSVYFEENVIPEIRKRGITINNSTRGTREQSEGRSSLNKASLPETESENIRREGEKSCHHGSGR